MINTGKNNGLIFINLFIAIISGVLCFLCSYWADEFYTMCIVKFPLQDAWNILKFDVHPPLYYLGAKLFYNICICMLPEANIIMVMKVFSFIPALILIVISWTRIQKYFGDLVATLFPVAIFMAPHLLTYMTEIRMYSWVMLFVVLAYLEMYELLINNNTKTLIPFTVWGVLATYTQYYTIIIFGLMLIFIFIATVDDPNIKSYKIFLSGLFMLIAYIPQIKIFLIQVSLVANTYGLREIQPIDIWNAIIYPFQSQYSEIPLLSILTAFIGVTFLFILIYAWKSKSLENMRLDYIIFALISPLLLSGVLLLISITIKPIFLPRYEIMVLPIFWIAVFYIISLCKKFQIPVILILVICFSIDFLTVARCDSYFDSEFIKLDVFLNKTRNEKTVFCSDLKYALVNTGILTMDFKPEGVEIIETPYDINDLFTKYDTIYYISETEDNFYLKSQDIQYTTMERIHNLPDFNCNVELALTFTNPDTTYNIYKLSK